MNEPEFWGRLEFRVCSEIHNLWREADRRCWCDGFIPCTYLLDDPIPRIEGRVWMGVGSRRQEQWTFTLLLAGPAGSVEELDWAGLLPPEDVTRWLTLDLQKKHLVVEPSVATLDLPPRPLER